MVAIVAKHVQLTLWPWVEPWAPRRRRRPPVAPPVAPQPPAPPLPPPAPPQPPQRPVATLNAIDALLERCGKFEAEANKSTSRPEETSGWNPNCVLEWHLRKAREAAEAFDFEMRLAGKGNAHAHKPAAPRDRRDGKDGRTGHKGQARQQR